MGHQVAAPPSETKLPPMMGSAIRVPTGEPEPEPEPLRPQMAFPQAPAAPPPPPIDQQVLEEARRKAAQIVSEAQMEARRLLEETRLHSGLARKQAHEDGMIEGKRDGLEAARKEFQQLFDHARDLYQQIISEREKLLLSCEPELARLSIQVAERIIGQEVRTNADVIMGVVKNALSQIRDREEVLIKVSPNDYHTVDSDRAKFQRMVEGLKNFEVVVDPRVEPGGCIIETNLGNVDARLSTQLAAIQAAFDRVDSGVPDEEGLDEPV